jgi:hypothetical protein
VVGEEVEQEEGPSHPRMGTWDFILRGWGWGWRDERQTEEFSYILRSQSAIWVGERDWNEDELRGRCSHYSQQPSYGNSQDAPLLMNGLSKCCIYTQWNFMQL